MTKILHDCRSRWSRQIPSLHDRWSWRSWQISSQSTWECHVQCHNWREAALCPATMHLTFSLESKEKGQLVSLRLKFFKIINKKVWPILEISNMYVSTWTCRESFWGGIRSWNNKTLVFTQKFCIKVPQLSFEGTFKLFEKSSWENEIRESFNCAEKFPPLLENPNTCFRLVVNYGRGELGKWK